MDRLSGTDLDARLREFLSEDVGSGDVTTAATVPPGRLASGALIARSECVVSGLRIARRVFELIDSRIAWDSELAAGSRAEPGRTIAALSGPARGILTAERVALNLLQRMCGIATTTRCFVEAVEGTGCRILDTRKTAPGLRAFDREAVRDGGGSNHRSRLSDLVLIKDNHRRLSGGVARAVSAARTNAPAGIAIEVEVESEVELTEALSAGATRILIDNQPPQIVAEWTQLARSISPSCWIEASGGIDLSNARRYALAGPDAISVGGLTHSVVAADISLELEPTDE
jgi:nicotinate-nucleotide pyrophosphorylase (carboxylating)